MVTVTFKCDLCGNEEVCGDLHSGYVIPTFLDMDLCRNCRWEAIGDLKKKREKESESLTH